MHRQPPFWLSVLIPAHNAADWIEACVRSVLDQAEPGVELVVFDDASSDSTRTVLDALQTRLPTLRVLGSENNLGVSGARNRLLDAARGDYVWFLDADDVIRSDALARLRHLVLVQGPDLLLCDFEYWRASVRLKHVLRGERHRTSFHGPSRRLLTHREEWLSGVLRAGQMHVWSKIARRAVWQGVRFPQGRFFEDMWLIPDLLSRVNSVWHEPEPWVRYRQHADSIMGSMSATKLRDLMCAAERLHDGFATEASASPRVRFALDDRVFQTFCSVSRRLQKLPDEEACSLWNEWSTCLRQRFPDSGAGILRDYRRSGRWVRWWRAQRSLGKNSC